jgi:phosphocarrier protein
MTEEKVMVKNRAGIHARPAAIISKTAQKFQSSIYITRDETKINAKSIMNIITLAAAYKTELVISAEGEDEKEAVRAIADLFHNRFEEAVVQD